jgi:vacuolar-type H+-ATPase subunit I/STV1
MTTINSLEDFLRALDANPAWREAVRARILGEELLKLPVRFNELMELQLQMNERIEGMNERIEGMNERIEGMNERIERIDGFVEDQKRVNEDQKRVNEDQKRVNEDQKRVNEEQKRVNEEQKRVNEEQKQFNERADNFMTLTNARMTRIESDISTVKGGHARTRVADFTEIIAANLDLDYVRTLTPRHINDIAKGVTDPTAVNPDQRASFVNADLVIEATDSGGNTVYVAVETSWTADRRDSGRSLRNARYLANSTGNRAIAVVASVRNDHEVSELISRGEVSWHRIPDRDLEPA